MGKEKFLRFLFDFFKENVNITTRFNTATIDSVLLQKKNNRIESHTKLVIYYSLWILELEILSSMLLF